MAFQEVPPLPIDIPGIFSSQTPTSLRTVQKRTMRMQTKKNPGSDFLEFGLTPTQVVDRKVIDYNENQVSGVRASKPQFMLTRSQELTFVVFMNEWGAKAEDLPKISVPIVTRADLGGAVIAKVQPIGVEQAITWLRRKMVPSRTSTFGEGEEAPPVLEFIAGPWFLGGTFSTTEVSNVFTCILTQADVTSVIIDPLTHHRVRSTVEITLREFLETPS